MALRARRGHARGIRHAGDRRRDARAVRPGDVVTRATSSASAFIPRNALRGYQLGRLARAAGRLVVFGGIHATLFPDEAREQGRRMRSSPATAISSGRRCLADCAAGRPQPSTTADASTARRSCRRDGICCRPIATCGAPCRPCAAVRNTARSARCGGPTDRSRGSAASTRWFRRSSRSGARVSGSSCSRTTTSIRSRSKISRRRDDARDKRQLANADGRFGRSASS